MSTVIIQEEPEEARSVFSFANVLSVQIIDDLARQGYSIQDSFIPALLVEALALEGNNIWAEGDFRDARIGKSLDEQKRPEIRSDKIHWLDKQQLSPVQESYWSLIDTLRDHLNQTLYLGLRDFEAHFAVYPEGSFYKKHLDQFQITSNRLVSVLLYMNKDWNVEKGGQLRIYTNGESDTEYVDILPEFGRFVIFLSGEIYHEVLPSKAERFSLTGWLRREAPVL